MFSIRTRLATWRRDRRGVLRACGVCALAAAIAAAVLAVAGVGPERDRFAWAQAEGGGLAGQLLVATPTMPDGRFAGTVIYMVSHDETGAMGVVVNLPIGDVPVSELMNGLGFEDEKAPGEIRLHYGGPVEESHGFVLHSPDYTNTGTVFVDNGLALTTNRDIMRDIVAGDGPRRKLVAFGYAGWSAGQLEAEMETGVWITVPADDELVFDEDYDRKWERAMARRAFDL
ncbi:MAG: YqgE/AlgH family protein [Alphaproteobacteria bacterium]